MDGRVLLALVIACAALLSWGIPALLLRLFVPALEESERAHATNWRGMDVVLGLGVVWLFWVLALLAIYILLVIADSFMVSSTPTELTLLFAPLTVVALGTFAAGIVDDALGGSAEKGFSGHVRALFRGRLTTGLFKLKFIGIISLLAAWYAANEFLGSVGSEQGSLGGLDYLAYVLFGGVAIALTANFANLMDLRPGRALKAYGVLAMCGAVAQFVSIIVASAGTVVFGGQVLLTHGLAMLVAVFAILMGPAIAAWPYDVGERAMLGDAGANPAGAIVGFVIVASLPTIGVIVFALLMLALNLASERWSFSAVIEKNRVLSWLDSLGREREGAQGTE